MSEVRDDLDRLNELLGAIPLECEGMTIGELDGYVAGLIVCPEPVLSAEWLPTVWGGENGFAKLAGADEIAVAVLDQYNRIARELAEEPESYAPVMEVDWGDGDLLWGPWINGFERRDAAARRGLGRHRVRRGRLCRGVGQHDSGHERLRPRRIGADRGRRGRDRPDRAGPDPFDGVSPDGVEVGTAAAPHRSRGYRVRRPAGPWTRGGTMSPAPAGPGAPMGDAAVRTETAGGPER